MAIPTIAKLKTDLELDIILAYADTSQVDVDPKVVERAFGLLRQRYKHNYTTGRFRPVGGATAFAGRGAAPSPAPPPPPPEAKKRAYKKRK